MNSQNNIENTNKKKKKMFIGYATVHKKAKYAIRSEFHPSSILSDIETEYYYIMNDT